MIRSIIKRDGRVVLYDESKIASAILKAMEAAGEGDATDAANVANDVQSKLEKLPEDMPPQIEQVQDTVERALMKKGFEESAKEIYFVPGTENTYPRSKHKLDENNR